MAGEYFDYILESIQMTDMALVPMVLEQDGGRERSFDLYSRMLRDRIVFCNGVVEDNMANLLVAQLLYLESVDPEADIYMYINSPGGSVTSGLAIFDTMTFIKPDIATVVTGQSCSMGSFLSTAGAKGKRYALKNSRIMIHQPSSGMNRATVTDMEIQMEETRKLKTLLTQYYADHTGQTYEHMHGLMERDYFLSAAEAVNLGLIDHAVTRRSDIPTG